MRTSLDLRRPPPGSGSAETTLITEAGSGGGGGVALPPGRVRVGAELWGGGGRAPPSPPASPLVRYFTERPQLRAACAAERRIECALMSAGGEKRPHVHAGRRMESF